MIDIAVLDPHPVLRAGLRRLVSPHTDLRIVGEATGWDEAETLLAGPKAPDVVLMELPQPGRVGFEAIQQLHVRAPDLSILLFTAYPAEHYAIEAFRQGARGYLNKNCDAKTIVEAVRTLAKGRRYFSPEVGELLAIQVDRRHVALAAHERLSEREVEVFYKLAKGESASAIAAALALSVKTVSTYRTRLLEKLGLNTNSDLTYYAVNNRLIG